MGSGKSTLGRALAEATGLRFVDLDDEIADRAGKSITAIFADEGEAAFRRLERLELQRLTEAHDVIVACGGGTPCQPGLMELMNAAGLTILLEAERSVLLNRLILEQAKRPLMAGKSRSEVEKTMDNLLREREPHYLKARHRFDSSLLESPEQVARTVSGFINTFLL